MAKKRLPTRSSRAIATNNRRPVQPRMTDRLLGDIRGMIEQARREVAWTVNAAMVVLYWGIGKRIREDILDQRRADYDEQIVSSLVTQLTGKYERGCSRKGLRRMPQFAEKFPDETIVAALSRQLGFRHSSP
jgi:hypothetical protein